MPKASLSFTDASESSLGIQGGKWEVVKAITKIHQYQANAKTGEQSDPFLCVQFTHVPLDENWNRIPDGAETTLEFSLGAVNRNGGGFLFHPAIATGPDDSDPADQGGDVDAEGNTLSVVVDGSTINRGCNFMVFEKTLEEKGFPPAIAARAYMPDFVGMKIEYYQDKSKQRDGSKRIPLVCKELVMPRGTSNKKTPTAKSKPESGVTTTATAPAPAPAGNEVEIALKYLAEVAADNAGKDAISRTLLNQKIQAKLMKAKTVPPAMMQKVLKLFKDDGWLQESLASFNGIIDIEEAQVTFLQPE